VIAAWSAENVEVKLRVEALEPIAVRLRALGARDHGRIRQIDTYFWTPAPGTRLKLRAALGIAAAPRIAGSYADL
jgi:adenylate cyclase class IV